MDEKTIRITRSIAKRLQIFQDTYQKAYHDATILVTPSATGKGVHVRWQYHEAPADDEETMQTDQGPATNILERELTEDEFADIFNGSLSSIYSEDFEGSDTFSSWIEDTLAYINSRVTENPMGNDVIVEPRDAEIVPIATIQPQVDPNDPNHIIYPSHQSAHEKRKKKERQERDEDMVFERYLKRLATERTESHRTIKIMDREEGDRPRGESSRAMDRSCPDNNRARRLGPEGTIIIDPYDQYQTQGGELPKYPESWVMKKLAGRASTEPVESPK